MAPGSVNVSRSAVAAVIHGNPRFVLDAEGSLVVKVGTHGVRVAEVASLQVAKRVRADVEALCGDPAQGVKRDIEVGKINVAGSVECQHRVTVRVPGVPVAGL